MRSFLTAALLTAIIATPALACGPGGKSRSSTIEPPALAEPLDRLLPEAKISDADRAKATALRAEISKRAKAKDEKGARKLEEEAMALIGYQKGWMACGPGTFFWLPANLGVKPRPTVPAES